MNPKVTVLMCVYNDIKYLKESIESILNQSLSDFEFLIIDDASTDGSVEMLECYKEMDSRIKLIKNDDNKGLSFNLYEGVRLATANWVARMDADDIAIENRLMEQITYIEKNPNVDVIGSFAIDIDSYGAELEIRKVPINHKDISKLIWTCPFIHPTVLFRKDSIMNIGSYNKSLRRRQDYDLWFRCEESGLQFYNIGKPLMYYRSTDDYFKKNNMKVQFQQAKMGIQGSWRVKASPIAYVGITAAFIKGILPYKLRKPVSKMLKQVDPRKM